MAAFASGDESGKDLASVMGECSLIHRMMFFPKPSTVRGNASIKASQKMSMEEMQWAIPSLMVAGQDTTVSHHIYQGSSEAH